MFEIFIRQWLNNFMKLKANCLLTKHPLCLVTGPRSLINYKTPWGALSQVLFEHGYKTQFIELPFRNSSLRKKVLNQKLKQLEKTHVVIDSHSALELIEELQRAQFESLTIIHSAVTQNTELSVKSFESLYLSHSSESVYHYVPLKKKISLAFQLHLIFLTLDSNFQALAPLSAEQFFYGENQHGYHLFIDHAVKLAELDFLRYS